MLFHYVKKIGISLPKSALWAFGTAWLICEPTQALVSDINITFEQLVRFSCYLTVLYVFADGFLINGFLRRSVKIKSNISDTEVMIQFGEFFKQQGCKVIGVNDFFDSLVDNRHISKSSLHGQMISNVWGENSQDWDTCVDAELVGISCVHEDRRSGKTNRYELGTSIYLEKGEHKFICCALTRTDTDTLLVSTNTIELQKSIHTILAKARIVCANDSLVLPLLGSALGRVGINTSILVHLLLLAIFEESKKQKITSKITIILSKDKIDDVNLLSIKRQWS